MSAHVGFKQRAKQILRPLLQLPDHYPYKLKSFEKRWQERAAQVTSFEIDPLKTNLFSHVGYEEVYFHLAQEYLKRNIRISPHIQFDVRLDGGPEQLFLGAHTGLAAMSKYAELRGWKPCYMTSWPSVLMDSQRRVGMLPDCQDCFPVDSNSLLQIIKRLRQGKKLQLVPDFKDEHGRYSRISPILFQLAERYGVPVYFYATTVDHNGSIHLVARGPFQGRADDLIQEYIALQESVRPHMKYVVDTFDYNRSAAFGVAQTRLKPPDHCSA